MPLISVIIPVYNIKDYISKCLESVINQTYKNIEIICVNDGSTDSSLKVLNEYAQKDKRIKIINNKHMGLSASRNIAINNAKGEYIVFADGDDWLEHNLIELAYNKISSCNADIVIYSYNIVEKDKIVPNKYLYKILEKYENKDIILSDLVSINHCVWDRMFKKKFLIDNNIRFPEEVVQNEDSVFDMICLNYKPKYCCLPRNLYNYLSGRNGSIMDDSLHIISNFIQTCKYFLSTEVFKNSSDDFKILVMDRILISLDYNYKIKKYRLYRIIYNHQITKFIQYLLNSSNKHFLNLTKCSDMLKTYSNKKYLSEHIFSVKNVVENHKKKKCITLCFLKIKF